MQNPKMGNITKKYRTTVIGKDEFYFSGIVHEEVGFITLDTSVCCVVYINQIPIVHSMILNLHYLRKVFCLLKLFQFYDQAHKF